MSKEHTEKNAAVEGFRNKQLTYKISVAVGILLVACLTVMIAISATIAAKFMNSSISGEFDGIAQQNGGLNELKTPEEVAKLRGISVDEVLG